MMAGTDAAQSGSMPPVLTSKGKASLPVMKFTSLLGVSGAMQTKNMSSGFTKEDGNVWWNRRLPQPEPVIKDMRDRKRRKLANDADHTAQLTETGQVDNQTALDQGMQSFPMLKGKGKAIEVRLACCCSRSPAEMCA